MNLTEGGNVFRDDQGRIITQRISQSDVMPTVQWLEKLTGLDFTTDLDQSGVPAQWLGSTGRKATSGDLDLQVDANKVSKSELESRLRQWAQRTQVDADRYIRKSGISLHFLTAINGDPKQGFVQTDFMFTTKPRWNQFVLQTDPASAYKGVTRNVLINSMAKSMGYKLNQNDGIADRGTNRIITDDPDRVAKLLLNPGASQQDLTSVERIIAALKDDPRRDEKLADFRDHMARAGTPLDEHVDTEVNWLARLRDRIVNQGMTMIMEAARIEHPEDMVFDLGSRGISAALQGIQSAAQDPSTTTVKWDGRPAIIFGRKPTGEFVLTDKAGFAARGYDGLATSPEHMEKIMRQRGGERGELIDLYRRLFPVLRQAVPQDFRGYVQGDLLYSQRPPMRDGAYEFTPNTVRYRVPADSELGQAIGKSNIGIVVHTQIGAPGAAPQAISAADLTAVPGLLILDPSLKEPRQVRLNPRLVADAKKLATTYGAAIDRLFDPAELRQRRITNLPQLMKTYINSRVRAGTYDDLVAGFGPWVKAREPAKTPRIFEWATENKQAVAAVFQAFLTISALKNDLVRQLDAQGHDVQASVNDEPGHEGYVGQGMKFVDRMRFSAANFARNNPELA